MRWRIGLLQDAAALERQAARDAAKREADRKKASIPTVKTEAEVKAEEEAASKEKAAEEKAKLESETSLATIRAEMNGALNYAILRIAHIYGDYESGHLGRALCMGRIHKERGMDMKFLYGKDMRQNTVHVSDVVSAAWKSAAWVMSSSYPKDILPAGVPSVDAIKEPDAARAFNIVDDGDTSQGRIAELIGKQFEIKTGFTNSLISSFARFNLDSVVEEVNEMMLQPWADLLQAKNISRCPITPFMEKELLRDADLCMSGKKAKETFGWEVAADRKVLNQEGVDAIVKSYERMGWWP